MIPPSEALVLVTLAINTVGATIIGALLGVFHGRIYEKLPGSTSIRKGLPLDFVGWIVEGPFMMIETWFLMPILMQLIRVVASLAGSLAFVVLLGFFYDKFR